MSCDITAVSICSCLIVPPLLIGTIQYFLCSFFEALFGHDVCCPAIVLLLTARAHVTAPLITSQQVLTQQVPIPSSMAGRHTSSAL